MIGFQMPWLPDAVERFDVTPYGQSCRGGILLAAVRAAMTYETVAASMH